MMMSLVEYIYICICSEAANAAMLSYNCIFRKHDAHQTNFSAAPAARLTGNQLYYTIYYYIGIYVLMCFYFFFIPTSCG